jgi:hypothetical protein
VLVYYLEKLSYSYSHVDLITGYYAMRKLNEVFATTYSNLDWKFSFTERKFSRKLEFRRVIPPNPIVLPHQWGFKNFSIILTDLMLVSYIEVGLELVVRRYEGVNESILMNLYSWKYTSIQSSPYTWRGRKKHPSLRISNKYGSCNCLETMTQPNNYVLEGGASNQV